MSHQISKSTQLSRFEEFEIFGRPADVAGHQIRDEEKPFTAHPTDFAGSSNDAISAPGRLVTRGMMIDGWCYQLVLSTKKNSTFYIHPEKLMAGTPKWRWMENDFPFQFGNFSCSTTLGKGGKRQNIFISTLGGGDIFPGGPGFL